MNFDESQMRFHAKRDAEQEINELKEDMQTRYTTINSVVIELQSEALLKKSRRRLELAHETLLELNMRDRYRIDELKEFLAAHESAHRS